MRCGKDERSMLVIESDAYIGHYPHWVFRLGSEQYRTKDVPSRVQAIRRTLAKGRGFEFRKAKRFGERHIAELHPYHPYIKKMSASLVDPKAELYPDLFPGEGARLPRKMSSPLWAGLYCTDAVTPIMMQTYAAARGSAECALTGAELLKKGTERRVYALCRPSGHHAGPRVFGGYCYFNNCACAAHYLRDAGRVAIVDIDYHHGNGTQEFFERQRRIFTASIHGDPKVEYPYFWGYANERGVGAAKGTNLNVPLPLKSDDSAYLTALERVLRALRRFDPAFLVIAAGFDTHTTDPIGGFDLSTEVYREVGARFAALDIPTLICQEGGYNVKVLGACARSLLEGFGAD
jgi:acetoin utilization deacetylase AcuC-like enzyme